MTSPSDPRRTDLPGTPAAGLGAASGHPAGRPSSRSTDSGARRPIRSRQSLWAVKIAGWLTRRGVRPNAISIASVAFAAVAGGALALSADDETLWRAGLHVLAAVAIQLRLLCNLLDGMVAVEGGRSTPSGAVYNELPDRVADTMILVGAGASASAVDWGVTLGWAAALFAVLTAYVRVLGASLGAGHHFVGPMAKQHRMALLTVACAIGAVASGIDPGGLVMTGALVLIAGGSLATVVRRTRRIVAALEGR